MAFLGLDIGTSGTKALLLRENGDILATAESSHETKTPRPGWTEQDPETWWRACLAATADVLKKTKLHSSQITAIGLSGQMHGSVFLGDGPKALRPALLWNDQRTIAQCEEIETQAGGREQLFAMVSNPALTGFTAPKILWFRQNEPAKFEKCRHILLPKDYIRYRLTGQYASEVSDASGTLLLNVKTRQWHDEMLRRLDIGRELLPRLTESQEISGQVTNAVANTTGLPAGIPVVGGAGDQAAGAVGTGVVEPGILSATMGTSGVIFAATAEPQTDPLGRVQTMCHAIPNTWCVFGCMLSAGGSLQWLRNTLLATQYEALIKRKKDPGILYHQLITLAQEAPAGSENLFFLPYLTGERCPHPDPYARGCFIGLTPRHTLAHIVRATLEGITMAMRQQVDIMRSMNIGIQEVRASGGGARSDFWRQLQADMYQAPVVTINVSEGAALGAAILAGVGKGQWSSVPEAVQHIIKIKTRCRPNARRAARYEFQQRKFEALYPALRESFKTIGVPYD
jgi:xylulokinase